MNYTITHQEAGWLEIEYQFSLPVLQSYHNLLIKHYQERRVELPAFETLQHQVHQYAAKQAIKAICQHEDKTPWEEPEWSILNTTQGLCLSISLEVLPKVILGNYERLSLEVPAVPIPTEEVLMTRLVDQQYALAYLEEVQRPIAMGDRVLLDLITLFDDKPLPLASKANLEVMVYADAFAPGFAEALVGLKSGDSKQIQGVLGDSFHLEQYRGKAVSYDVCIHKVFAQELPPVEELPELLGFENLEALMDHLYEEKREENQDQWLKLVRRHLLLQVAAASTFTIPATLHEAEMISRWEQKEEAELQKQGVEEVLQDESLEQWLAEPTLLKEVAEDLACNLVGRAIAHAENLDVSPIDLLWAVKPFADRFDMAPELLIQDMKQEGQLAPFCDRMVSRMVLDLLYSRAELVCEGEVIKQPEAETPVLTEV
jgi:trigger factor